MLHQHNIITMGDRRYKCDIFQVSIKLLLQRNNACIQPSFEVIMFSSYVVGIIVAAVVGGAHYGLITALSKTDSRMLRSVNSEQEHFLAGAAHLGDLEQRMRSVERNHDFARS